MKNRLLVTLLGLSLFFTACSTGSPATATQESIPPVIADDTIVAEGRLEPFRYADIAFSLGGVVSEVPVKEGQIVKKGDLLIQLGGETDTQYSAAKLELVTARKELNDLLNASDEDFAQAVINLKEAKDDYDDAVKYMNYVKNSPKVPVSENFIYYIRNQKEVQMRMRTKHSKGPAPQVWITEAENDVALKKAEVDKAQRIYDRMKDEGVDRDQLAVMEARVTAAEAGLAAFSITAPFDGIVANLDAKAGNSINPSEVAVTVADFSSWLVETTDLTEIDVVKLAEDQPVTVKLDALPDVELKGTILSIGQTYTENQGDVVYKVTVVLTDTHPDMRWGMTANVTFPGGE
ncbi:MAG TPA: HlyD family efflux transporter periplasmic adaptor subunit [Anaerolineales bacterium]|nr:HlyD family efflux transporter periplasmic adaptor subunit [Anaerolineales bacterium]